MVVFIFHLRLSIEFQSKIGFMIIRGIIPAFDVCFGSAIHSVPGMTGGLPGGLPGFQS